MHMETKQDLILKKLREIFIKITGNQNIDINLETNMQNLLEWDSLLQVILIENIEAEFHINFALGELEGLNSITNIIDFILEKTK